MGERERVELSVSLGMIVWLLEAAEALLDQGHARARLDRHPERVSMRSEPACPRQNLIEAGVVPCGSFPMEERASTRLSVRISHLRAAPGRQHRAHVACAAGCFNQGGAGWRLPGSASCIYFLPTRLAMKRSDPLRAEPEQGVGDVDGERQAARIAIDPILRDAEAGRCLGAVEQAVFGRGGPVDPQRGAPKGSPGGAPSHQGVRGCRPSRSRRRVRGG